TVGIDRLIQEAANRERTTTWTPGSRTSRKWPICLTCNQEVDAVRLENVNNHGCEIVANHHNSEDAVHVSWTVGQQSNANDPLGDPNVGWELKRAMADVAFFDPSHHDAGRSK